MRGDIHRLNRLAQEHPLRTTIKQVEHEVHGITAYTPRPLYTSQLDMETDPERVPVTEIQTEEDIDIAAEICAALVNLINAIKEDPTVLRKCTECGSIYLRWRLKQKYCSHRCSNAAGTRRRRHEKKALAEVSELAVG